MLDSVRTSACMPAPPLGSVPENTRTMGGDAGTALGEGKFELKWKFN